MWLKGLFLLRVAGLPGVRTAGVCEHIYIIYIIRVVDFYLCAYMFYFALFDSNKQWFNVY